MKRPTVLDFETKGIEARPTYHHFVSNIGEAMDILNRWIELNAALMSMEEPEAAKLLEAERKGKARLRVMLRIYHRLSKLRGQREKREIAACAKA